MRIRNIIIAVFCVAGLFNACSTTQKIAQPDKNLANIYNPSKSSLHPEFSVQHINDSISVVYLKLFPGELLFTQANETGEYLAKFSISFQLLEYDKLKEHSILADSASINKSLDKNEMRNRYYSALPIKAKKDNRYILFVKIKDELRQVVSENYLVVDKKDPHNRQNFRVLSAQTGYPSFTDIFTKGEQFYIKFREVDQDSLFVSYFTMDRTLPRPVFSRAPSIPMKTIPDSAWSVAYNDTSLFSLDLPGIYMFKLKESDKQGLTLYNFGENFPRSKTSEDMIAPLVYLCSSVEFRDLRLKPNRKLALDNYWLNIASNMDDARELIRIYYRRVLYSNLYFSSYKEGWKTDRGMIYIIYGPPDLLEKGPDSEKWGYRSRRSSSIIEFVFDRNDTPLSYNDFVLNRNTSSTALWTEAVESWKRGKIYTPDF